MSSMTLGSTGVFALSAAVIWGAADFSGGLAARRLRVYWLLAISHGFSLVCLVLLTWGLTEARPPSHLLWLGFWSGLAGGAALLTFYYNLSLGNMGVNAALTGVVTAALPVGFTLATVGAPGARQVAGFVLAAASIWLISSRPSSGGATDRDALTAAGTAEGARATHVPRRQIFLSLLSGIGFGLFLIFLRQANEGGLIWPLAASRIGSLSMAIGGGLLFSRGQLVSTLAPALMTAARPSWKRNAIAIGVGLALLSSVCDTSGNFLFVAATRVGRLDIAAVLSSLYPASTILLAAWFLKERTTHRQVVGMVAALVAVVLIS